MARRLVTSCSSLAAIARNVDRVGSSQPPGTKLSGTWTLTQPPLGLGYEPARNCCKIQLLTAASPNESLATLAEHAVPVGLTRTAMVILPCNVGLERKALL